MHCPGTYRNRFLLSTAFTPARHRLLLTIIILGSPHHPIDNHLSALPFKLGSPTFLVRNWWSG